jgi:hypothetical protein
MMHKKLLNHYRRAGFLGIHLHCEKSKVGKLNLLKLSGVLLWKKSFNRVQYSL